MFPEALELEGFRGRAEAWDALDEESKRINIRSMEIYAGMVENMDFHIGRVVDYLKASRQYENTVILFFSDNGASGSDASFRTVTIPRTDTDSSLPNMGREGSFVAIGRGWAEAATAPYRDVKGSLHEGGTLAAAFVTHSSVAEPGGVDRSYLTMMDVLPTLLDIAGTRHPGVDFHGREVLPIRGRSFWARVRGSRSRGDRRLVRPLPRGEGRAHRALERVPRGLMTSASPTRISAPWWGRRGSRAERERNKRRAPRA